MTIELIPRLTITEDIDFLLWLYDKLPTLREEYETNRERCGSKK